MNRRGTLVGGVILLFLAITGAALSGVFTTQDSGSVSTATTTDIVTAEQGAQSGSGEYGLLPLFQRAYNDSSQKSEYYTINDSSPNSVVTGECGNCHLSARNASDSNYNNTKHDPPLHPIGLYSSDSGSWFYDDGNHRGPNTRLADGYALIAGGGTTQCGACHTPNKPSQAFGPDITDEQNDLTNDPHSVHRDVLKRIGCIRCHVYNNRTFTDGDGSGPELVNGNTSDTITFVQGNATHDSYGIANPINMTREWDGKFLSTTAEAAYTYSKNGNGKYVLNTSGTGYNKYGSPDGGHAYTYACPDCHDQYHYEGGFGFAFKDSADSRKGPQRRISSANSIGVNSSGAKLVCKECHSPTSKDVDVHAVHTNGNMTSRATWAQANATTNMGTVVPTSGVSGDELCDECHSQNLVLTSANISSAASVHDTAGHGDPEAARKLGLTGPKNRAPDNHANASLTGTKSGKPVGISGTTAEDCGFCHKTKNEN